MEENSLQMLHSMLKHTEDPEMREMLEHHVEETKQHRDRLQSKLESSGEGTSATKRGGALVSAMFKGVIDQVRTENRGPPRSLRPSPSGAAEQLIERPNEAIKLARSSARQRGFSRRASPH